MLFAGWNVFATCCSTFFLIAKRRRCFGVGTSFVPRQCNCHKATTQKKTSARKRNTADHFGQDVCGDEISPVGQLGVWLLVQDAGLCTEVSKKPIKGDKAPYSILFSMNSEIVHLENKLWHKSRCSGIVHSELFYKWEKSSKEVLFWKIYGNHAKKVSTVKCFCAHAR